MVEQVVRRARVGFDPAVLLSAEIITLCLPALLNGGPLLYPDVRAYYLGGQAALTRASSVLWSSGGSAGAEALEAIVQKARGVRSVFYSLFVYIPGHALSLSLVVVLQAIIIATMLRLVFNLMCPDRPRWQATAFIMFLSIATTLSWTVSMPMPDVFTPVMALSMIITIIYWSSLRGIVRCALFVGIAGSMVMHMSNLPIAFGILLVGMCLAGRRLWTDRARYAAIGAALLLGLLAMLGVGVVGFHQWTIAPQAPPFLLARSLADGPARLYLLEHCPQIGLLMCQHLDKLDLPTETFIWDKAGVYSTVSPKDAAELRAEDKKIFVAAALEHPWMQIEASTRNIVSQLGLFTLQEHLLPLSVDYTATGMTLTDEPASLIQRWPLVASVPEYLAVVVGLGVILHAWRKGSLSRKQKHVATLILATILLEALAAAISEPAPRYEARVTWLIPMAAFLFVNYNSQRK